MKLLLMASNVRLRALAILLVFVMLLRPYKVVAPNNLTAGGYTLTPPRYITSPSGIFAFGFRALDSDPTKFILAIWFRSDAGNGDSSAQPQSVVWFAKESPSGRTPVATAESVLSITVDGQLALTGGGKQELWIAPVTTSQQRGSVLTLRDSGNLQLLGPAAGDDDDGADTSNVVWQSFWYPTDTLLPGQSLAKDDARSEGKLFSKRADAEFTTGRFSMGVQTDGNIVLYLDLLTGNSPSNAYWQAYTDSPDGNTTVTFDDQGRLNYTLYNGTVGSLIPPPAAALADSTAGGYFRFARMDPDGVVRAYYRPKNNGGTSWSISGSFPSEGCNKWASGPRGMCGPGSYCVETPKRLSCMCPSGYTYADDQHKDEGCWPEFVPQSCGGNSSSRSDNDNDFDFVELPRTTWEWDGSAYYKKFTSVTEEQCRSYCLSDCFCAAALVISGSDGGSDYQCLEAALLTNARQRNDATRKVLVKVRSGNSNGTYTTPTREEFESARTRRRMLRPYKVITVCLAFLLSISVATAVVTCKLWQGYTNTKAKRRESSLSGGLRSFTYKELERATNGFKVQLGEGGFGEVYKGEVSYLQPPQVAVKKLMKSDAGYSGRDFQNEVQSVGQIHHKYLVRMIGYCQEGAHRMLVFEYMQGGTLADFIFRSKSNRPCWSCIAEAAVGIAKGLEYLHEGCKSQIIHCDIKPDNILFDDKHTPKITDFGIAKLLGDQRTQYTVTRVAGTRPYIAPEWFVDEATAKVDSKVDVYSFGVMLLEMICCRRTAAWAQQQQQPNDQGESTMRAWAESLLRRGRAEVLVEGESEALTDMESVERFTRVAIWCMQREPSARPRMCKVVQMLQGTVDVDPLPDPPRPLAFFAILPDGNGNLPQSAVALEID